MRRKPWFSWHIFGVTYVNVTFSRPVPQFFYNRLANAGRLQIWRFAIVWPLPWNKHVRDLPGYGR